ncbi:Lrp/AsnC family transcriptional regulator [Aestuariivirga sp. YIM B02566]|uniref:Lrp/AsnC family transcriptional regulator n=1 Tax=Taklimakanibacter albus TaxID=2800327 RepID=A0ACC5RB49_9HYPH|nr:Lrp/AsnC family transcriptional regulator [Aestuariivirga sp. YIM B02566]MBK1869911.1 Lrp/AsnC family transcriptional regulator [Aestuariivirga sp. YIM B02566]
MTPDDKDREILTLLREDARISAKALAAKVGLARSSLRDRIAKLEKAGIIRGYRTDIADPSLSAVACLLVKLKTTPSPQVVKRLERLPEVKRCLSLAGEIDLLIDIAAESLARLNQIRDEISHFPEVAETTTAVVLRQEI